MFHIENYHVGVTPPHIITISEINQSGRKSCGYYVTLKLTNIGKSIAKGCEALITATGEYIEDGWITQDNWFPLTISWVFDEWALQAHGKPREERDLVPKRPYLFHALGVSSNKPDLLCLYPTLIARNQCLEYPPRIFCFEITAFSEGAKTVRKYVHVEWEKEELDNHKEIPDRLKVGNG